ncbi:MAG: hypothetical protein CBC87_05570 [Rickettsiales bacterium TMED127]|nr:MAG: hypothetical protein CBC87_05570 [Rickettsiales bacterium TMED127]|tara:strand:- start:8255 stop:8803 length:549 start_codon:yes stop_codon:yes gene_type:complete
MKNLKNLNFLTTIAIFLKIFSSDASANVNDKPLILMILETGVVKIETYPKYAPNTVKRIVELSNKGFYDGLTFHRVIKGFMAQGGDPNGDGTGGSGKNLKAEFNELKHERGIISMARAQEPDSADSQFFICYDKHEFLDGQYTAFGKVIEGMHLIDRIPGGKGNNGEVLSNPTKIISMRTKN